MGWQCVMMTPRHGDAGNKSAWVTMYHYHSTTSIDMTSWAEFAFEIAQLIKKYAMFVQVIHRTTMHHVCIDAGDFFSWSLQGKLRRNHGDRQTEGISKFYLGYFYMHARSSTFVGYLILWSDLFVFLSNKNVKYFKTRDKVVLESRITCTMTMTGCSSIVYFSHLRVL